jgi:catechol 2,3-dioxygenase-like lactoylglutathione lyase family enzyme
VTAPQLNAIGLVSSDLDRTVAFYRALGCELPDPPGEEGGHLVAQLGDFRLMIDTEEIIRSFDPHWQPSGSGRLTLAVQCGSPGGVDRLHDQLSALGSGSYLEPFDAVWAQRYATVLDPDGVHVDLYAALVPGEE